VAVTIKQSNPGWLKKLLARWKDAPELAIGWPTGTNAVGIKYPDGTPVVLVAAVNNFGSQSRGIPARPFMTESAAPAVEATKPIAAALMPAVNSGKATLAEVLQRMGPFAVGAFQQTIVSGNWVANSPVTIARKDSAQPLVDTALMRQSRTFVVRKPGG